MTIGWKIVSRTRDICAFCHSIGNGYRLAMCAPKLSSEIQVELNPRTSGHSLFGECPLRGCSTSESAGKAESERARERVDGKFSICLSLPRDFFQFEHTVAQNALYRRETGREGRLIRRVKLHKSNFHKIFNYTKIELSNICRKKLILRLKKKKNYAEKCTRPIPFGNYFVELTRLYFAYFHRRAKVDRIVITKIITRS